MTDTDKELQLNELFGNPIKFVFYGKQGSSASDISVSIRMKDVPRIGEDLHFKGAIYKVEKILHKVRDPEDPDFGDLMIGQPLVCCAFDIETSSGEAIQFPNLDN